MKAVMNNEHKQVIKWLGSPVDKKRLSARYPDHYELHISALGNFILTNSDLSVHIATIWSRCECVGCKWDGVLSLLLQQQL